MTPLNFKRWLTRLDPRYDQIHIEPVTRDNGIDMYCRKEETRIAGPYSFGTMPKKIQSKQLKEWMQKVGDINDVT